ncbi:hypothetical protein D9Q98_006149 [Chlorella vulgaris]|uniref:thioredoxin-dependent peroxiredoxin n=1 Tax=Chlorella vulgaris TaxID=3077 RepID=A0A9D4TX05_CHLVU|nr:hypothetical protein D9Q98_006149 [Chlorella vulgaris]
MATTKRNRTADLTPENESKKQRSALAVGDVVPDVQVLREDGETVKVRDLVKNKGIVIFMYPRANTGGCTKQACGFKDKIEEFAAAGFDVYGMSFDKPKSQSNWKAKYSLPYHLLTDEGGELLKAFGAAKGAKSVLRSHVIIAKGGKLLVVANGIKPGDSFAQASEFCAANPQE